MRRRFGRGRKSRTTGGSRAKDIDAASVFARIIEAKLVPTEALEPVASDDIPDNYAMVGVGEGEGGRKLIVAFAPDHGGDAALAGLAHAQFLAARDGFAGEVIAVCPQWSIAARRRLALLGQGTFSFRAIAASALADGENTIVSADNSEREVWLPAARVTDRLVASEDRELFSRGLAALEGLAAKHGGVVRGIGSCVEFVLLSRRVALIRADEGAISLETILPEKSHERLDAGQLATALDRLEGHLRKRLNDRRIRTSEEGVRSQLWAALAAAEQVRQPTGWPLGGADAEVIDFAGVGPDGVPVIGALRSKLSLPTLGVILDAVAELQSALPALLADAEAPVRLGVVRLALAAAEFDGGALALLPLLALDHKTYDIVTPRGRDPEIVLRGAGGAAAVARPASPPRSRPLRKPLENAHAGSDSSDDDAEKSDDATETESAAGSEDDAGSEGSRPGSARRRRGRGRRGGSRTGRESGEAARDSDADAAFEESGSGDSAESRFDSISLFDLDDGNGDEAAARRSRRGRGRRRGRGNGRSEEGDSGKDSSGEADAPEPAPDAEAKQTSSDRSRGRARGRGRGRGRGRSSEHDAPEDAKSESSIDDDDDDDDGDDSVDGDTALPVVADIDEPDLETVLVYDDDADDGAPTPSQATAEVEAEPTEESDLRRPRRRAAIVAHADRGSVVAAILLARDIRLLEGFWVYPQEDLMTFFRSIATDLRDQTPIYLVGFTASPARDIIQAASLYAGRIAWFDHHDWPPEDLDSLREAIGAENIIVTQGNETPVSAVLVDRTRRSRFSDKIVELVTGRFSEHDFERWGRVWWERLASIAAQPGDRRAEVDAMLVGRPSDLAREAAKLTPPAPPPEVDFIAGRDFRIVHFGGYRMVVVPVPPEFDLHFASRVARERYGSELSLSFIEGEELMVFSGDEGRTKRNLDMLSMATHLDGKHDWIEKLPSEDYVARIRVHDFASHPDRLDEVISQIAMGRSILEG